MKTKTNTTAATLDTTLLADIFPAQPKAKSTRKNAAQISADNKAQKAAKILDHKQAAEAGVFLDPSEIALVQPAKPAAKKAAKVHPVINPPCSLSQASILERDLPAGSLNLFQSVVDAAPNWSDCPPTYEFMPVKGSTIKADEGHLTNLKKLDLITTQVDSDNADIVWASFTKRGEELRQHLIAKADAAVLVVDGTKPKEGLTPALAKKAAAKKTHTQTATEAIGFPPATTPVKPAKAPKVKINRAQLRYAAITECMTRVKADTWRKAEYKPTIKWLELEFPLLYAKLKTKEKVAAYSAGILDFCLAACRKLNTKP